MGSWSDEAKERSAARRAYRLDEACAGVEQVLNEEGCTKEGAEIPKKSLYRLVVQRCQENRRINGGIIIPTIENTEVRAVDRRFLKNNWSEICQKLCEDYRVYMVWTMGKGGGVRLGTLEEYEECQRHYRNVVHGTTEKQNRRAEIINERGGESPYISNQIEAPK